MGEWGFFVDENLEPRITYELEQRGFEAENVRDTVGRGADDSAVLEYARERDYVASSFTGGRGE